MKVENDILILMNDFSEKLIGVQVSAIQRAKMLYEFVTPNIEILTTKFNKKFLEYSYYHMHRYGLNNEIKARNLYFDILAIKDSNFKGSVTIKSCYYHYSEKVSSLHEKYYDNRNNLKMYVVYSNNKYDEAQRINYINYFNNKKKFRRDHFIDNGLRVLSQILDDNANIDREEYFDQKGVVRIIKNYKNKKLLNIYIYDGFGLIQKICSNETELITWWLENYIVKEKSIFIVDGGPHHIVPLKFIKDIKIISVLHSNHIRFGEDVLTGSFNSFQRKKLLETNDSVHACVILTDEQKLDIEIRLKSHCPLYSIPHPVLVQPQKNDLVSRDINKLIIISRLELEKNIYEAINIFKLVVKIMPEKKLYIYGDGSEKNSLIKYVEENNLSNNIFFEGYTNDISEVLNSTTLFLMTSLYESFGLSISESLSHGVPVLSYDFKYGPRTLIKHNKNGFLIKNKDTNSAARTIIQYYENLNVMESMVSQAYDSTIWLSSENVSKMWIQLFKSLD